MRLQRLVDRLHHAIRAAYESRVDVCDIDPPLDQRIGFVSVDAAVEDIDVLRLAAHDVDQIETL